MQHQPHMTPSHGGRKGRKTKKGAGRTLGANSDEEERDNGREKQHCEERHNCYMERLHRREERQKLRMEVLEWKSDHEYRMKMLDITGSI